MASSSSAVEATPPWQDLPREITTAILQRLGPLEILTAAQYVCTAWRSVCREPSMWRSIDMREMNILLYSDMMYDRFWDIDPAKLCRHAVDLSQGQLTRIYIDYGSDDLLLYVSQRSGQLRCLQIADGYGLTHECLTKAFKNLPLLEELYLHYTPIDVEAVGRSCPLLKSFTLKNHWYKHQLVYAYASDGEALAIANNMPGLHHLQLFGNAMTNKGLLAILEGCPHLQSLDLRRCFKISLGEEIRKLCSQRIEDLRLPHDPMNDRDSDVSTSGPEDHPSDFSDMDMVSDDDDDYPEFSYGSVSSYEYEDELYVD